MEKFLLMSQERRWYEKNPMIKDAMHAWEHFPPVLQRALAIFINNLIKKDEVLMHYQGIYNFAPRRLKILYQIRKKARWYDRDPKVRNVLNKLILVRHDDLIQVCRCIIYIRAYIRDKDIDIENLSIGEFLKITHKIFNDPKYK